MALTLEADQRLCDVGLTAYYAEDEAAWLATAKDTKSFVKRNFPADATIRRDDVAKALVPVLEVHEEFKKRRDEKKLRAKYWIRYFADLIIDRTWDQLGQEAENVTERTESENDRRVLAGSAA